MAVQKNASFGSSDAIYNSAGDALAKIYTNEGISGLYSGLSSAVFGIAVTNGVYYYWYETVKTRLMGPGITTNGKPRSLSTLQSMLAGAIAGAATTIITNPIWVINMRMTVKGSKDASTNLPPQSTVSVLLKTVHEEGLLSLWQGILPALILVANPIIQCCVLNIKF
jgi:solute carrier family 25 (peroxisomal adenine nucleotide transporter), member 17